MRVEPRGQLLTFGRAAQVSETPLPYLLDLTLRLARGVAGFSTERRRRHAQYLLESQRPDGGFAGREGASDLYYTSFALRSLALLGELEGDVAERAGQYLRTRLAGSAAVVDLFSLIFSAQLLHASAGLEVFDDSKANWRRAVAEALESLRRRDGGYAKSAEGEASSTYYTFLASLCLELIEVPLPDRNGVVRFVLSQRRDDGGFVEIRPMRRSGANPTAAAVGLLKMADALTDEVRSEVAEFLAGAQTDEGGMRANTRIDVADLLSTFTATLTLADLNRLDAIDAVIDTAAVVRYAESVELAEGGFLGASWDAVSDVEYTFYGLGTLALLSPTIQGDPLREG